jgi:glycosyltransferase involved in cell wall biosynthesis
MQNYDNLVVVVADDGSTDDTREMVTVMATKDPRIQYHSNPWNPGMRDNFEYALSLAQNGYVIALGSDDGLMPGGILGMRDALQQTRLEMLSWAAPLYAYPKVRGEDGQLMLYHPKKDKIVDSREFLKRQARRLNYLGDIESPMFYVKGVTSTRLVQQVRSRHPNDRFYQCATPDGYSGIVLAGEVKQYAFCRHPFAIYGLSPSSQGLNYLANDESAKKTSEDFFKSVAEVPMHAQLASQPYSPLISLMTADYLLKAGELDGWPGPAAEIDYRQLISASMAELAHGLYGDDRLMRELTILRHIAAFHGLESHFSNLLQQSRRKKAKQPFAGNGINPRAIFLDASRLNIHDIVDAAHAAQHLIPFYAELMPKNLLGAFRNSLRYFLAASGKGGKFPALDSLPPQP